MKMGTIRSLLAAAFAAALLFMAGCGSDKTETSETAESLLAKMSAALEEAGTCEAEINGSGRMEYGAAAAVFDFALSEQTDRARGRSLYSGSAGLSVNGIEMDLPLEAVYEKNANPPLLCVMLMDQWAKLEAPRTTLSGKDETAALWKEKAVLAEETENVLGTETRAVTLEVSAEDLSYMQWPEFPETGAGSSAAAGQPFLRLTLWIDARTFLPVRERAELLSSISLGGGTLASFGLQRDHVSFGAAEDLPFPEEAENAPLMDELLAILQGGVRG